MKSNVKKLTLTGVLTALATLSFVLESLFPPLFLPGARLGISNLFILLCLILCGIKYGAFCLVVKVLLSSLFSGNLSSIMYSLPAGLISLILQAVLLYLVKSSFIATSVSGAVVNTVVQNAVFCLVTRTSEYLYYSPYLALIAIISGLIVGFAVYLTIKILPEKFLREL